MVVRACRLLITGDEPAIFNRFYQITGRSQSRKTMEKAASTDALGLRSHTKMGIESDCVFESGIEAQKNFERTMPELFRVCYHCRTTSGIQGLCLALHRSALYPPIKR